MNKDLEQLNTNFNIKIKSEYKINLTLKTI